MNEQSRLETLQTIHDNSRTFLGLLSLDGTVLDANRRALASLSINEAAVVGKPFWDAPWWAHSREFKERAREAAETAASGVTAHFEARHPCTNGSWVYAAYRIAPIFVDGEVVYLLPEGKDITEQKNLQTKLQEKNEALQKALQLVEESEGRFRMIADSAPAMIWLSDADGYRTWVNEQYMQFTGLTREALLGDGWQQAHHPDDLSKVEPDALRTAKAHEPFVEEMRIRRSDGNYRWFASQGVPRFDAGGEFLGFIGILADIEISRQGRMDLERLNAELEHSNEDLEYFAYVASHDLKQPLRGIDHLASWIHDDAYEHLPESSRKHLVQLRGRIRRLDGLLDDLLAYSRAGRKNCKVENIDLALLVGEIAGVLDQPDDYSIAYVGTPIRFNTYRTELQTVLRNLLGNAIKHRSDRSKGRVEVNATLEEDKVHFCVADDGPGIAKEFSERVFRVFHTLKTRDELEGTGMGLAIVKKLVESRGGTISLESDAGKGCTFRFDWPIELP